MPEQSDAEKDEPRCQYVSDSPWGWTQCALPDGHEGRHAYSPSETTHIDGTSVTPPTQPGATP